MATKFYLPEMLAAEHEIAALLARLMRKGCDRIEPDTEGLLYQQPEAVKKACTKPVSILRGQPGTGKTTTLRRVVSSFDKAGMKGVVLCPTGKARKRADEVINGPDENYRNAPVCSTIHRGLEYSMKAGGFQRNYENPLDVDYVVADEFPMSGCLLSRSLFMSIKPGKTRLVLCGDDNQLPSVEPGNVMHDMIKSEVFPDTNLTNILRQGKDSGIAYNSSLMLRGLRPIKEDPKTGERFRDFFFVPRESHGKSVSTFLDYVCDKIPEKYGYDPINDIQVLSPGKKSDVGTKNLNDLLRDRLNPGGNPGFMGFKVKDKVINRVNNLGLGIVNGDVGFVKEVGKKGMIVDFGVGDTQITAGDKVSLHLAYCFTVHSSQGSEFPVVLTACHKTHYQLLFRNLIYTAVTRARNLSMVIGEPKAFLGAIERTVVDKRQTGLARLLARI